MICYFTYNRKEDIITLLYYVILMLCRVGSCSSHMMQLWRCMLVGVSNPRRLLKKYAVTLLKKICHVFGCFRLMMGFFSIFVKPFNIGHQHLHLVNGKKILLHIYFHIYNFTLTCFKSIYNFTFYYLFEISKNYILSYLH